MELHEFYIIRERGSPHNTSNYNSNLTINLFISLFYYSRYYSSPSPLCAVDDLRRLIEKAGGTFEAEVYSQSVTMIAGMDEDDGKEEEDQDTVSMHVKSDKDIGNDNIS